MKQRILVLFFSCLYLLSTADIMAQPMSAFTNFQDHFMIWDNKMIRKIATLPPIKVEIGRIAVPYIDDNRSFNIYYKGGSTKINDGFTNRFYATDNLIAFLNAKSLNVWDRGAITNLSRYCEQFLLGDSLIVFFEGVQKEFRAYYNGRIYPIEGFLAAGNPNNIFNASKNNQVISSEMQVAAGQIPSIKVSDNIGAYVNYANQFRIFYRGQLINQEEYLIENFDVGRNTVAYVDANQQFKIFWKNKTRIIDDFAPVSYAAGDDMVAFIANDYSFKIFYNDSIYDLGYMEPEYVVHDYILAFQNSTGHFEIFYKGKRYPIDNFYPGNDQIKAGYNSLAYVDKSNVLKMFSMGNTYQVTNATLRDWRLDFDVLQYQFGSNMYKVFYEGKTY